MAEKKPKPVDPPGATCTPAQVRLEAKWVDVWIWAVVAGALTAVPQVVWSEAKAGAPLVVSPVTDTSGARFRVTA